LKTIFKKAEYKEKTVLEKCIRQKEKQMDLKDRVLKQYLQLLLFSIYFP
jgi:predicted solute-binding protein